MRDVVRGGLLALVAVPVLAGFAQGQLLAPITGRQHITVTGASSASSAPAGGALTLWADVTPKPGIHVYAAGATDFKPVGLVVTPHPGVQPGTPKYPKPDVATAQGSTGDVPAYSRPFRISLPITIARTAARGERLTVAAAVNYQACDDRICYPPSTVPISWTFTVR